MAIILSDQNIEELVNEAFPPEEYTEVRIEMNESEKKNKHLGAFLKFVNVVATDKNDKKEEHHLVVKIGKSKINKEKYGLPRESFFFETTLPLLLNAQKGMELQNSFNQIPKCYKISTTFDVETIIMENVCKSGYEVLRGDRINDHNIRLVLKAVAKFHALSFATRIMSTEKFKSSAVRHDMLFLHFLSDLTDVFRHRFNKIKDCLKEHGDLDLLKKFDKLLETYNEESALNILKEKVKESVITHGDLHNMNIMFKYEKENDVNASDIMLIDFQLSGYHSPVLDLSYYLYFALTPETYQNTFEYLKCYHREFSSFLNQLHGMDAEELFSFSLLLDHWRRYSFFGFAFIVFILPMHFEARVGGFKGRDDTNLTNTANESTKTATSLDNLPENKTKSATEDLSTKEKIKQATDKYRSTLINEDIENNEVYRQVLINTLEAYLLYGMDI